MSATEGAPAGGHGKDRGGGPDGRAARWRSRPGTGALAALAVAPGAVVLAAAPDSPLLLGAVVAGVLLAWLGLRLQGRGWRDVGLHRPRSPLGLALAVGAAVALLVAIGRLVRPGIRRLTGEAADLSAFRALEGDPVALLGGLVVVWTVAAVGEELLYRGFLLNALREIMGPEEGGSGGWAAALVATSALSGLGHLYQGPTGMILTGILALGFGGVYLAAGRNLWAAILTHGIYDTLAFVLVFLGAGAG